MLITLMLLAACTPGQDEDSALEDCPYNAATGECVTPLTEPGPTWSEFVAPRLDAGSCEPYTVCPASSPAHLAFIHDRTEFHDVDYYDPDGTRIASVFRTDAQDLEHPCECQQQAIEVWQGPPVASCPTWNATVYALPSCPVRASLTPSGEVPNTGVLTNQADWDATEDFRTAECAGISTCSDGLRALVRQPVDSITVASDGRYGVDVFEPDGALVGTANVQTLESWGLVPDECLTPTEVTPGCGISP